VVTHQVSFQNPAFLLTSQLMQYLTEVLANRPEDQLLRKR